MSRRPLTRDQVLSWNSDWSYTDREMLGQELDRVEAIGFYVPPSGGYVGCTNADGRVVMTIAPGYVYFKPDTAPAGRCHPGWNGYTLSTFRERADTTSTPSPEPRICSTHNVVLPATGICDDCD